MKNQKQVAAAGVALAILLGTTGCGKNINGSYALTETQSSAMLSTTCQSSQLNLVLTENNSNVTGNASNACFTETLTGVHGSDQLTGVTLTVVQLPAATQIVGQVGQGQYGVPQVAVTCSYTGTLTLSNNQLSGSLALASQTGGTTTTPVIQPQPGQPQTQVPVQPTVPTSCAPSVSITGTLTGS